MTGDKLKDRKAASIAEDDDNPEWTDADFARAKPALEVVGSKAAAALVRGRGRPAKEPGKRKRQVTLRLAPDVLEAARASGPGWQTRAEQVLRREFLSPDPVAERAPHKGGMVSMREAIKAAVEAVSAAKGTKLSKSSGKVGRSAETGRMIGRGPAKKDGSTKRA
jgi:uncharacterized protein (DUF4415 family)